MEGSRLSNYTDSRIVSLAFCDKSVSKELKHEAALEWTRRVNERNLQAALERQKEIMNNERMD